MKKVLQYDYLKLKYMSFLLIYRKSNFQPTYTSSLSYILFVMLKGGLSVDLVTFIVGQGTQKGYVYTGQNRENRLYSFKV